MVEQSFRVTDPATLRALAHPLRQRIILELSVRHSARASDLAEIVGEPANAISYHLRALAKASLLVEAPELARDGRDRVWRLAHPEGLHITPDPSDPDSDPFTNDFVSWVRDLIAERIPEDPRATRGMYLGAALLTKEESKTLFLELAEVLERWRCHGMDAAAENPRDPERVFHHTVAMVGNRATDAVGQAGEDGRLEEPTTSVS